MNSTPSKGDRLRKIAAALKSVGLDNFLLLLLAMIVLASLYPPAGLGEGLISLKNLANYGIGLIFFFYGLRLGPEKLRAGLTNWRLHLLIHLSTFILFPLLILSIRPFFKGDENMLLWLGIFYLAALPSTVSSSVVMVSIARGNLPAAIFNASISSLLGVFITPLWVGWLLKGQSGSPELGHVVLQLVLQVLLPVVAGMLLNRHWGAFAERHKKTLRMFDQGVILLIIYTSFCESFHQRAFDGLGWDKLLLCCLGMVSLFFLVFGIIGIASKCLRFNQEDTITALFCGSKKSLVHGTVMSKVLFVNYGAVGVILLPTMLYHALQLIIVSVIARKMGRRPTVAEK